ncbi:MAG: hypothetical protein LBL24_10060 [Bacteroidales bacterium]|jgi:hypothetical protein|nr:hypothetical protein [Bacteroidales bacterium]
MIHLLFSDIFILPAAFRKAGISDVPVIERIFIAGFLWVLFAPFAFSQNEEHADGDFLKRVEYNLIARGGKANNITFIDHYNLLGKGDMEKLFFGDFNAPVEFVFDPSAEYDPCIPSGFRMVKDSVSKSFILEVKYISNYGEASKEADKEARDPRHMIDLPAEVLDALPGSVFNLIRDHNSKNIVKRYFEELPKHFRVERLSFPVSDRFAEKLYGKMVSFIDHFKAKGVPPTILDGYSVTFRTVVDDEVWSLSIHEPQGDALQLADLCRQIITDAKANTFDESNYVVDLEIPLTAEP